ICKGHSAVQIRTEMPVAEAWGTLGVFWGGRRKMMALRGQRVRSLKVAAVLVAMMLVSAGCGARLSKSQLAKAAAGGGQTVSAGGLALDEGGAGGDQAATAGGGGAAGGATGGAAGGTAGKAGSAG